MKRIFLVLTVVQLLASCGGNSSQTQEETSSSITITSGPYTDYGFETYEQDDSINQGLSSMKSRSNVKANEQDVSMWVKASSDLPFSQLASAVYYENFISSGYNQQSLLLTLFLGADGNSASQLSNAIGIKSTPFENNNELLLSSFNTLDQQINSNSSDENSNFTSSTSLWGSQYYPFSVEFSDQAASYLGANLHSVDFINQPEETTSIINDMTSSQTADRLSGALESDHLGIETALIVSNTNNFNSAWRYPFPEDNITLGEYWLSNEGTTVDVPIMNVSLDTLYYNDGTESIVALPYENPDWTLYIVSSVNMFKHSQLIQSMNIEKLHAMIELMSLSSINLSIPKFSFSNKGYFTTTDISDLFDKKLANLSALHGELESKLFVRSTAVNDTIELNEQGLHYSSAAHFIIEQKPVHLNTQALNFSAWESASIGRNGTHLGINGPFLFFLYHNPSKTVLVAGNLVDPR